MLWRSLYNTKYRHTNSHGLEKNVMLKRARSENVSTVQWHPRKVHQGEQDCCYLKYVE